MSGSLYYNIYTCCRWLQRCTCQSVTFLSHGLSSPPTAKSYRAPLRNLSCTVFAHCFLGLSSSACQFQTGLLPSAQTCLPLSRSSAAVQRFASRSTDQNFFIRERERHVCVGRTGRPTVIGVAAAHLCRCKVNVCSCIYSVLAAATNTPYSDNIVFASAYAGGSLPSVFTQLWESRVGKKHVCSCRFTVTSICSCNSQELWHRLPVTASRQILF